MDIETSEVQQSKKIYVAESIQWYVTVLCQAITYTASDDAWRLRFIISDHDPNEQVGEGVKYTHPWPQTVGK
jgi:hypothetical protein